MKELKLYDDCGRLSFIKSYDKSGLRSVKGYDKEGNFIIEIPYKNGKKHGVEKRYYKQVLKEGKIKEIE